MSKAKAKTNSFDISAMATDVKKENEGVWHDYDGGLRLKIARLNNEDHQQFMLEQRRKLNQSQRFGVGGEISKAELKRLTIEGMALHILVGWECMVEDGKTLAYSLEEAVRIITKYPKFFRLVEEEAMDDANFKIESDADELGNSESSATGTQDGGMP